MSKGIQKEFWGRPVDVARGRENFYSGQGERKLSACSGLISVITEGEKKGGRAQGSCAKVGARARGYNPREGGF